MIKKSLVLLALSAFAASSAFATVTSHKVINAVGAKLTIKESKPNAALSAIFMNKAKTDNVANFITARTMISDLQIMGQDNSVQVEGDEWYGMYNSASEPKTYTVDKIACTFKKDGDIFKMDRCSDSKDFLYIESGHSEFFGGTMSMSLANLTPGEYIVEYIIDVTNGYDSGDTMFSTYDARFFTIPAAQ